MKARFIVLASVLFVLVLGLAAESRADISNAAVLFLRIAPGSRAAGMGEAYVAIADDATATHWNPAGLGNAPLSDNWIDARIPSELRPIKAIAPFKSGSAPNYLAYDIWALTGGGLARYDNRRWNAEEVFSTRTDETVEQKVRSYFVVTNEEALGRMVARVVAANSERTLEAVQQLRDAVMSMVPEDHADYNRMVGDFDSLVTFYSECKINWERYKEIESTFRDAAKDSVLDSDEVTRLSVGIERSRTRFIPEELRIPYSAIFDTPPTSIASTGDVLLVGSTSGLARFNGRRWQMQTTDDGLPSSNISCMAKIGSNSIVIGTDSGAAIFNGLTINRLTTPERALPAGTVEAIGGRSTNSLFAVVEGELYHFNGQDWSSSYEYTVVLDDSIPSIAAKFSLYGTPSDLQLYREKYNRIQALNPANRGEPTPQPTSDVTEEATGEATATELSPTGEVTEAADPESAANTAMTADQPAIEAGDTESMPPVKRAIPGIDMPLQAGQVIDVPYLAQIKGRTNVLFVDDKNTLWLGTEFGLFSFNGGSWNAPGYSTYTVKEGENFETLVGVGEERYESSKQRSYAEFLKAVNELDDEPILVEGQKLRVYANALASEIRNVNDTPERLYFATSRGLVQNVEGNWERVDLRGLGQARMADVATAGGESWLASETRVVIKGRGRSEITFMHVNWLPELADDLYYDFFSFVTQKEGWGTFGGNVTFISYGKFTRTGATGEEIGTFESFDIAFTASYGTPLTAKLRGGVSAKVIYSRLSDQGVSAEKGKGTSTGFAVDLGLMYIMSQRLQFGLAVTNIGPKMAYIDAAQSDDLPRNLAFGFAYKLLRSEYNQLMITAEFNKLLVGLDDGFSTEIEEAILNGGIEYTYNDLLSARAGYIYDQEGDVKTPTLGIGLRLFETFKFDFSYVPSQDGLALANTLRISLGVML